MTRIMTFIVLASFMLGCDNQKQEPLAATEVKSEPVIIPVQEPPAQDETKPKPAPETTPTANPEDVVLIVEKPPRLTIQTGGYTRQGGERDRLIEKYKNQNPTPTPDAPVPEAPAQPDGD